MDSDIDKWDSLYKHPRWFKFRDEILKRDNYQCTVCGNKSDLRVHHTYYIKSKAPWQYPPCSLLTLCESCHYNYHITHEITYLDEQPKQKKKIRGSRKTLLRAKKKKKKPPRYNPIEDNIIRHRKKVNGEWVIIKPPL